MAEIQTSEQEFRLFHDLGEEEKEVLRKFIDPEIDLTPLRGIDELINRIYHLLKQ
ncbi:MAG: hypothetical protein K9W43_02425 [Candidatus Thorarchaeota archaeon]|nr:hypothetical protein [Candidatus Thorarchaeota archaeon]